MFRVVSAAFKDAPNLGAKPRKISPLFRRHVTNVSCPSLRRSVMTIFGQNNKQEPEIDDPGDYEIIIPPDPPIWGVKDITTRDVPNHISIPVYAIPGRIIEESNPYHGDPYMGDGRIELNSEDEKKLRRANNLAKRTLAKASELIRVSGFSFV